MDLTTSATFGQVGQESLAIDPASLYQAFEQVKDRRRKKWKRYLLAFILTLIILALSLQFFGLSSRCPILLFKMPSLHLEKTSLIEYP